MFAHGEIGPPGLNRNNERNECPDQCRRIELHLRPGQYQTAEPQQYLCYCEAENDRKNDREVGKGVHIVSRPLCARKREFCSRFHSCLLSGFETDRFQELVEAGDNAGIEAIELGSAGVWQFSIGAAWT